MKRSIQLVLSLCLVGVCAVPAAAEVKLPSIFGDHMVLQRDKEIAVWGWDDPGTEVVVVLEQAKATATASDNGQWQVKLPAQSAGGPFALKVTGSSTRTISDVLIGEVWLASGQSNMEWTVTRSKDAEEEIAAGKYPKIRHIKIPHVPSATPQQDVSTDGWQATTPETVGQFTAVGYFFARCLHKELDVPIGIIGSNWGGTRIEPWTPPVGFKSVAALKDISENLDQFPAKTNAGKINHQSPLALYNGMISPLVPYTIRGALWYQGESNNGEGMLYHEKMKALIAGWRSIWNDPQLPFYFVQLAPYQYGGDPTRLAGIWEAQLKTLSVPHTGMAVTVDIANLKDIHPKNKQDVGKRLCKWALAKTYGREGIVYSGPLYREMEIEGDTIRLHFDHVGSGLKSRDGEALDWFQIAGEDKNFVDAQAKIDGDTIVVSAEGVAKPKAVRFGWHQDAEPNLSNQEGLPASPFRTDSW